VAGVAFNVSVGDQMCAQASDCTYIFNDCCPYARKCSPVAVNTSAFSSYNATLQTYLGQCDFSTCANSTCPDRGEACTNNTCTLQNFYPNLPVITVAASDKTCITNFDCSTFESGCCISGCNVQAVRTSSKAYYTNLQAYYFPSEVCSLQFCTAIACTQRIVSCSAVGVCEVGGANTISPAFLATWAFLWALVLLVK